MDPWLAALVSVISSVITAYVTMRLGLKQQEARFRQELALKLAELRMTDGRQAQSLAQQFAIGVVILYVDGERRKVFVPPGSRITAGRDPGNEIVLPSKVASRQHFALYSDASTVYVEDLGSANGVYVNGERVHGRRPLLTGDMIGIGDDVPIEFQALP
jgi:pSer/pThr/pTyr-binding forkhead associated (FHA) protein